MDSFKNYQQNPSILLNRLNLQLTNLQNDLIGLQRQQLSDDSTTCGAYENVPFTIDEYEYMNYKSKKWIKIFEHNSNYGFFSPQNVTFSTNPKLYSILKLIPKLKRPDMRYSFILRYPGHSGENIFSQLKTPFGIYSSKEEMGLITDPLSAWTGEYWRGLMLSNDSNTYMHCSSSDLWHAAIGAYTTYRSTYEFPGPWVVDKAQGVNYAFNTDRVILWMEIRSFLDNIHLIKSSSNCNVYFRITFSYINMFTFI